MHPAIHRSGYDVGPNVPSRIFVAAYFNPAVGLQMTSQSTVK